MQLLLRYRTVIYAGTLITGFTGLVYQVVWQKYLGFILGSDARAVSLVVATFLAGLAAGYGYWGGLTQRVMDRRKLLRIYGFIELGIGVYAALFLAYFKLIRMISYAAPASLVTDTGLAILTLVPPTFLMGATIPLLVKVVPEHADEVHLCHARIYGINTLGAFLGAFGAGFVLLPKLGLASTLFLASALNAVVGLTFILNPLRRSVIEQEEVHEIPNRFAIRDVYLYTLVTGTITLSLEVLFIRVLHQTIGSGPLNFALVVGVFVLGLALGSLIMKDRMLSVNTLFRAGGFLLGYLILLYFTVPYWPYWMSDVRALLRDLPINYDIYMGAVTAFLMIMLLPMLLPLGFMLPLVYALIPKNTSDYGRKCGWIYFYNTLGTATGAVLLSYVALKWIDLDQVFKLDLALLAAMLVLLLLREKRRLVAVLVVLVTLGFLAGPRWDRRLHYLGLFREGGVSEFNFKGWLTVPTLDEDVRFFEDGPDTTITVFHYAENPRRHEDGSGVALQSMSLLNNGRSEGDTVWDYATMTLLAMLPYLYGPQRDGLDVGVVGLGCGVTAGLLGQAEQVERVVVPEISPTVVKGARLFEEPNHGALTNPKVEVAHIDGFKYFARLRSSLDIVVSEPSVVWSVGVENLFTPEYYRLVDQALADDGVFTQWFPAYTVTPAQFRTILQNLLAVFPHLRLYQLSTIELGILASRSPLPAAPSETRFNEPAMRGAAERMGLHDVSQLAIVELYDTDELRFLVREGGAEPHTLDHPTLAYGADRHRFLHTGADLTQFLDSRLMRFTRHGAPMKEEFARMSQLFPRGIRCDEPYSGTELFCKRVNHLQQSHAELFYGDSATVPERLRLYDELRLAGVIEAIPDLLSSAIDALLDNRLPGDGQTNVDAVMRAYVMDSLFDEARADLERLHAAQRIPEAYYQRMLTQIGQAEVGLRAFARSIKTASGGGSED